MAWDSQKQRAFEAQMKRVSEIEEKIKKEDSEDGTENKKESNFPCSFAKNDMLPENDRRSSF